MVLFYHIELKWQAAWRNLIFSFEPSLQVLAQHQTSPDLHIKVSFSAAQWPRCSILACLWRSYLPSGQTTLSSEDLTNH